MISELTNHLWQSTLFGIAVGLLTMAFRKNRAEVRYWLWLSASLKFFIPFSLLMGLGSHVAWTPVARTAVVSAVSFTVVQFAQPFSGALASAHTAVRSSSGGDWIALSMAALWAAGFGAIALMRLRGWQRVRAAVRASAVIDIPARVTVRSSPGLLEPGVVGLLHPILLLPAGIVGRLTSSQLEAVLAHELWHVRRRDNLTSAIHMLAEAIFWFHPLVWWIGARLVEERERACDEAVLRIGGEPYEYAQGILAVCKSYVKSPLSCVSGVTGSNLKKRIEAILTGRVPGKLNFPRKASLAVAAIAALAVPIVIGMMHAPTVLARESISIAPKFEEISIKPCETFRNGAVPESAGKLQAGCKTLQRFMQGAYGAYASGQVNPLSSVTITGGPAWTDTDLYEIDATSSSNAGQVAMKGPMLRALLEDRFKLKIHRETREIPVYQVTEAKDTGKLQPFQGSCVPWDYDHPNPGPQQCAVSHASDNGIEAKGWTMADLCYFFLVTLDRPVIDETGKTGRFNFHLGLAADAIKELRNGPHGAPARTDSATPATTPLLVSAVKTAAIELGVNLRPTNGPSEFIVIDSAQKPSAN